MLNNKYRVAQKSVNLQHSPVIREMFRYKPANHFVERQHSIVSSVLNTENLIYNNSDKSTK
jgi:hypothetical protein